MDKYRTGLVQIWRILEDRTSWKVGVSVINWPGCRWRGRVAWYTDVATNWREWDLLARDHLKSRCNESAMKVGVCRDQAHPLRDLHLRLRVHDPRRHRHRDRDRRARGGGQQGCQMAIARFLDRMCLALRASGLWLRYATPQNLIPSFPWIAPPRPPPWRNPRKGRDQILPSGNPGGQQRRVHRHHWNPVWNLCRMHHLRCGVWGFAAGEDWHSPGLRWTQLE